MISSWLFLLAVAQDAAPAPSAPAPAAQAPVVPTQPVNPLVAELASKFASLEQAKSYAFALETESSGGGRNREGEAGGGQPRPPVTVSARFQSGFPLELKQGDEISYLSGDVLVHKTAEGVWEKVERGGRGPRPEGGAPPKADDAAGGAKPPEGAAAGEGRGPGGGPGGRGGMGGMQNLRSVIAPHKLVEGFDGKVKDVSKSDKDGKAIYTGTLTDAAAAQLAALGGRRNRGGGGGEGPQLTNSGSFEIVFGADGAIESIRIDSQSSGTFGDRTIEMKRKSTYRISELGKVEVKVPEDAAKLFEA